MRMKKETACETGNEIKKSMAYDLIQVLEKHSDREIYTAEEVKQLIKEYIATATK